MTDYKVAPAPPTPKDSIRVQFDTTIAYNASGWTIMRGNPVAHVITATGGNTNTLTVSTISTSSNNWLGIASSSMYPDNGSSTGGTVWNYATTVMKECVFESGTTYSASFPQIQISGLRTSKTYTLQLTGTLSTGLGFSANGEYRILGSTLLAMQTLDARPGGSANTTNSLTFTPITPDGSGNIFIYFNPAAGQQLACLSGFILKEL